MSSATTAVSTYLEEFGDPAKFEDERRVPFSDVLQYSLGLIGSHVLISFGVISEAIALLDHVDALVAEVADDEHVSWKQHAKKGDPEVGIRDACQDSGKDGLRNEEDRGTSHQGYFLDQSHR